MVAYYCLANRQNSPLLAGLAGRSRGREEANGMDGLDSEPPPEFVLIILIHTGRELVAMRYEGSGVAGG